MINHINTLSPLRAAGKKIDTRGQRKIVIMSDRTFMKRMKAGEILVYTYKIFVFIRIKYSCTKGRKLRWY